MIHNSSNRRNVKNWLEENGDVMSVVVVMLVLGFMVVAVYVLAGSGRLGASVGVAVSSCVGLVGLMLMPSDGTTGKTPVGDQTADGQGGGGLAGVIEGLIEGLTGEPVKKDAPTPAPPAAPGPSVDWGLVGNITLGIIGALIGIALLLLIAARLRRLAAVRRAARLVAAEKARIEAEAAAKDIILWNERRTLEGELWDRFKQYEINPRLRITRPFMVDLSEPLLQAATTAMLNARALNTPTPPAFDRAVTDVTQTPYYRAVGTFDMALRAAEDKAAKVGQRGFSQADREKLHEAMKVLDMAENEAGTQAERRLQYERVINILKRLEQPIKFKPEAIAAIEAAAGITLELTSTPHLQDA